MAGTPTLRAATPLLLELFSGTGSVGRAFRDRGWDVYSLDNDPQADATVCTDVLTWDYRNTTVMERAPDVIWASPPCTMFSKAVTTRLRTEEELAEADALVRKVLEIWEHFGRPPLFVENPWTSKLKHRGILDHFGDPRVVDYCQFGFPYRKRTAIWTNTEWVPSRPLCNKTTCSSVRNGRRHIACAQRGSPGPCFTQRELYRIPAPLCDEIAEWCAADKVSRGQ